MALFLRSSFPLHWTTDSIHYLGVDITPDPLYSANLSPLLLRLKADLLHWYSLTPTWFGRCNDLKMTMLPKVLYLLQALPIHLPLWFFQQVEFYVCIVPLETSPQVPTSPPYDASGRSCTPRCAGLLRSSIPYQNSRLGLPWRSETVGGHGTGKLE